MRIIDTHTHLGDSRVTVRMSTEASLLKNMDRYRVDGVFAMPLSEPYPDARTVHDQIYRFTQDQPGRVWGVAAMNPRHDEPEYVAEVTRCVKELGFVAVKLHPYLEGTKPHGPHAVKVYETAQKLGVPVIVHTGFGVPQALPSMMIPIAKRYPDLIIVLAHAGCWTYFSEALLAAQLCDNVFLEMSTTGAIHLQEGLRTIGAGKMMFGSDGEINVGPELAKVEALDLPEDVAERYLSGTAISLYGLKPR